MELIIDLGFYNSSTNSTNDIFGHSLDRPFSITVATYFICLIISGILFNSILIHTIRWGYNLQNTSNSFIVNLAICDLIIAIAVVPFDADFLLRGYYRFGTSLYAIKEIAFMFSLPSSMVNLLLLTFERFIKIIYPYRYCKYFTKGRVCCLLWATWTYCGLVALFPIIYFPRGAVVKQGTCFILFPFHYVTYQIVINFFMPLLFILIMNMMIFRTARRHAQIIERQKSSLLRNTQRQKSFVNRNASKERQIKISISLLPANYKAAKTIMILVGVFLVCWLSYIVILTANISCKFCHPRELTWIGNLVNYSSIVFNPVLYGLHNKRIRKVLTRRFVACFKRRYDNESFRLKKKSSCPKANDEPVGQSTPSKEKCPFITKIDIVQEIIVSR